MMRTTVDGLFSSDRPASVAQFCVSDDFRHPRVESPSTHHARVADRALGASASGLESGASRDSAGGEVACSGRGTSMVGNPA